MSVTAPTTVHVYLSDPEMEFAPLPDVRAARVMDGGVLEVYFDNGSRAAYSPGIWESVHWGTE